MILTGIIAKKEAQWIKLDDLTATISDVLDTEEIRFTISVDLDEDSVECRDEDIRPILSALPDQGMLLVDYIASLTTNPFPVNPVTYLGRVDMLVCRDLFDYPVNVTTGNSDYGPDRHIPVNLKTDIVISNDIPDISQYSTTYLFENCLFSVNGVIFPTIKMDNRLFIIGAAAELARKRDYTISVLDFGQFGNVNIHQVKKDDIKIRLRTMDTNRAYRSEVGLTVPEDLNGKTYFLVAAGYLCTPTNTTYKLNEQSIYLDVNHSTAASRLLKMHYSRRAKYIDGLHYENDMDIYKLDATRLLSQGDTMVVVIDRHDICNKETTVYSTGLSNTYSCHREPNGPIFTEDGRLFNYRIDEVRPDETIIRVSDSTRYDFLFDTVSEEVGNIKTTAVINDLNREDLGARLIDYYAPSI